MKEEKKDTYIKRMVEPSASNPFVNELSRSIVTRNKYSAVSTKRENVINLDTGELSSQDAVISRARPVEKKEFLKIFSAGISAMFSLQKGAQDMFQAILQIYVAQKFTPETVYLNPDSLLEAGYARQKAARIRAMNILINNGFIAEVKNRPNQFWINPNMFYKGDRMTLVQTYAVKGTEAGNKMQTGIDKEKQNEKQGNLL